MHPGIFLEEDYIKPLKIENIRKLADALGISRKAFRKIQTGLVKVTAKT